MLPYKFRTDGEYGSLLSEADGAGFGQIEGFRPVVVIDSSSAVGESLPYIRAALKRMLYSFIVAKSKFNLVKFSSHGRAVAWERDMVQPTTQHLRDAEEFLDGLKPVRSGVDFLGGMHMALSAPDVDAVYLLSPGLPKRGDLAYILSNIISSNLRRVPIHVIGIDCDVHGELGLRQLAEENNGCFRQKRFDGGFMMGPETTLRPVDAAGSDPADDARLTIGGQVDILQVMIKEQEVQETDWLEEQKCANRLLLTSATQQPVPEPEQKQEAYARLALHRLATGSSSVAEVMAAAPLSHPRQRGSMRRGAAQPAQRASSQPRAGHTYRPAQMPSGYPAHAKTTEVRRPSVANPWDRPGAYPVAGATPIRVSQMMAARQGGASSRGNSAKRSSSRH